VGVSVSAFVLNCGLVRGPPTLITLKKDLQACWANGKLQAQHNTGKVR